MLQIPHLAAYLESLPLGSEVLLCITKYPSITLETVTGGGLRAKAVSCSGICLILNMVHITCLYDSVKM